MARPKIEDNDAGKITVTVDGEIKQVWVYTNADDRKDKMRRAWAWCDGYACASGEPLRQDITHTPPDADKTE